MKAACLSLRRSWWWRCSGGSWSGANAGALALLAAWSVPDLAAARAGEYYEGDLLGTGALAAVLLAVPFARPEVSWLAGLTGGALGALFGIGLHRASARMA